MGAARKQMQGDATNALSSADWRFKWRRALLHALQPVARCAPGYFLGSSTTKRPFLPAFFSSTWAPSSNTGEAVKGHG